MSAGISSVLPSATYAGALTEFWANAGAGGGGGGQPGVTQIVAGNNITISPGDGEGVVTINATAGGATGVTEILAVGDGIAVSAPTGIVNISNTGVTSLVAGAGIAVSAAAGAVTVSSTPNLPPGDVTVSGNLLVTGGITIAPSGQISSQSCWSPRYFTGPGDYGGIWYTQGLVEQVGAPLGYRNLRVVQFHARYFPQTDSGSATVPLDSTHTLQVDDRFSVPVGVVVGVPASTSPTVKCALTRSAGVGQIYDSIIISWSGIIPGSQANIAIAMLALSNLAGVS
jgi:hypothetical protein